MLMLSATPDIRRMLRQLFFGFRLRQPL